MSTVLLYPCNLLGYVRFFLIVAAVWVLKNNGDPEMPWLVTGYLSANILLDVFDGYLARRFSHTSPFGAMLDLVLDLTTYTILWLASGWQLAIVFIVIEWTAGALAIRIALRPHQNWKQTVSATDWRIIHYYFSRQQRNWLSAYSNVAHFLFPVALFVNIVNPWCFAFIIPGLIVYEAVTLAIIVLLCLQLKR